MDTLKNAIGEPTEQVFLDKSNKDPHKDPHEDLNFLKIMTTLLPSIPANRSIHALFMSFRVF